MTIDQFLGLVPWDRMAVNQVGEIRTVMDECPIVAVWGGLTGEASVIGLQHGLPFKDVVAIMQAADDPRAHLFAARAVRADMVLRLTEAQIRRQVDAAHAETMALREL